ncbi:hypothetical protein CEXT_765561 [Caerostris extrusa]|uniref:Uncharacterized protein n=1 Tax=Caerostris extrusa TaxID=172846 RepID=A0AAV4XXP0_CAEEX|nr:hypothetical protein CEXT_765561 [Caerostris extrusa]
MEVDWTCLAYAKRETSLFWVPLMVRENEGTPRGRQTKEDFMRWGFSELLNSMAGQGQGQRRFLMCLKARRA